MASTGNLTAPSSLAGAHVGKTRAINPLDRSRPSVGPRVEANQDFPHRVSPSHSVWECLTRESRRSAQGMHGPISKGGGGGVSVDKSDPGVDSRHSAEGVYPRDKSWAETWAPVGGDSGQSAGASVKTPRRTERRSLQYLYTHRGVLPRRGRSLYGPPPAALRRTRMARDLLRKHSRRPVACSLSSHKDPGTGVVLGPLLPWERVSRDHTAVTRKILIRGEDRGGGSVCCGWRDRATRQDPWCVCQDESVQSRGSRGRE